METPWTQILETPDEPLILTFLLYTPILDSVFPLNSYSWLVLMLQNRIFPKIWWKW